MAIGKTWSEMSEAEREDAYSDAQDMIKEDATQIEALQNGLSELKDLALEYERADIGTTVFAESVLEKILDLWNKFNPEG